MVDSDASEYSRLWFTARKLVSAAELSFERRLQTELGVGRTLYLVLSAVQEQPGVINQREIADLLGTTQATISRQLEVGTRSGWLDVAVSRSSRREHEISLTAEGEQVVRRGDAIILEESRRMWHDVSADEVASAARVIDRMLAGAIRAQSADPPLD
jgi:DNA-binding MarR family transcriptional regulator